MRSARLVGLVLAALAFGTAAGVTPPLTTSADPSPATVLDWLNLPTVEEALAPGLAMTLLEAIVADDGDGKLGPTERVRYTGTLSNPGDATTTGISFEITLDPNLTVDGTSISFAPVAVDDLYQTDTDTPLIVNAGDPSMFLSANDFDLDKPLPKKNVVPATGQATSQGGTVDITNRGGFTYTPPGGFTGDDTFTYTLIDRSGATDVGTATIEVGDQLPGVWFVDDDAAPGGNGSMSAPFQDHTQLNGAGGTGDVDEPGHVIFFYEGTYDIDDSFHLEPGQRIVGQGVDLVVDSNVIVSGSPSQRPALTHDTGHKILLADNVELAGFDVGTPTTPVGGIGLNGSAGGLTSLTIDEMTIHTNGGPALHLVDGALDIDLLDVNASHASGAAMIIGGSATGTTTIAGTATLSGTVGAELSGNHTVNFATVDIDASAGAGIDGFGSGPGTLSVTFGAASPLGKSATNGSIDAIGGPALDFSNGATVTGTLTSLSSTNSADKGLYFNGSTHDLTVTGTTAITGATGIGLHIAGVNAASSFTFGATSVGTAQEGIFLNNNGAASISFGDTDVSNITQDGIEIVSSTGTHTFGAGSSIFGAGGYALRVDNGAPTVGFDGSITNTLSRSVSVTGLTGGSVTVGGTIDDDGAGIVASGNTGATVNLNGNLDLDTGANSGLFLNGSSTVNVNGASNAITTTSASAISCNAGAILAGTFHDVDVSAGTANGIHLNDCVGAKTFVDVDLTTTGAHGFHASSAGSLQVTGMTGDQGQSTVNTTNGRAIDIQNSTIGVSGMMFGSVSASGGDHGIRLSSIAGSGAFHVTGVGPSDPTIVVGVRGREGTGNGTGGTIANSTNDHVSLTSVNNVVLRHMVMNTAGDDGLHAATVNGLVLDNTRIDGTSNHGIRGTGVTALTILNSELINAGNASDEDAVHIIGLFGDSFVTNTEIDEHHSQGIFVSNATRTSAVTPDRLMVQNSIVTDSDPTDGAVAIEYNTVSPTIPIGTALSNFALHVTDSEVRRVEGNAILVSPQGQSGDAAHVEVRRTTIVGSGAAANVEVPSAVQVNPNLNGSATFVIADNPNFSNLATTAVILKNDSNGSLEGYVTNNTITAQGSPFVITGDGASGGTLVAGSTVVSMTGNTMSGQIGGNGAQISAQDNTGVTTDVTYQNNSLTANGVNGSGLAIDAQGAGNTTCVNYTNNTINAPSMFESVGIFPLSGGAVRLQGMAGNSAANATAYIDGQTNEVGATPNSFAFATGGGTFGSATCATPGFTPFTATVALHELATASPEPVALAAPEKAPMPRAEAHQPRTVELTPRRTAVDLGTIGRSLLAARPEADDLGADDPETPAPSVEIGHVASMAGGTFTFAINDLPAGVSSTFIFEATAGQTIKASALETTVTVTASNAPTVMETASTPALPSRQIPDVSGAGWRTLGAPAEDFTVDDLAGFNLVQCIPGYYENDGICDNQPGVNLYTGYDGTSLVPASGGAEEIERGTGFYWYLFDATFDPGAPGPSPSQSFELPTTLSAAGPVPAGDVTVPLHNAGDRWNLLANPFPMDLDVSGIGGWTIGGTLQTPVGQIWNPNKNTFTLTSQKDDKLAAWQGAFFRNFDAASLQFMASAQVADAQFIGKAPVAETPQRGLSLELTGETPEGHATADEAISLAFSDAAHPGTDALDVDKLAPPLAAFAVGAFEGDTGDLLAQRSFPHELDRAVAVPLHVIALGTAGRHTLSWPRVEEIPTAWTLRLMDRVTGAEIDLREADGYTFEVDGGGTEAARAEPAETGRAAKTSASSGAPGLPAFRPTVRLPETAAALTGSANGARFLLVVGPGEPDLDVALETGASSVELRGAFPNPFGTSTALRYALPSEAHVRLVAYDVLGREVAVLVDAELGAGTHTATWASRGLASGTYVVRLRAHLSDGATVERSLRVTHNR